MRQNYLDFLGREPDESGFNFWSDQMLECGTDTGASNEDELMFLRLTFSQSSSSKQEDWSMVPPGELWGASAIRRVHA